jgi:hypothetical protein
MNAHDVIEGYVTEVALQLPRRQRNDVAFELRALLQEELQDKAEAAGRVADEAMATELVRAFGRPAAVAARYRPTLTIIDPADGPRFFRLTAVGLLLIWVVGLFERLRQPIGSAGELLGVLGQWWMGTVVASLWWPGVLVVYFGLEAWARRRRPESSEWKPRAADRIPGGRATHALGMVGILCGVFVLLDPTWILDFFWGGRAAPSAYEALTYTDTFRARQAPWLLGLLLFNIPLFLAVIVRGRWSAMLRRAETVQTLALCGVMAWTVADGPVFNASTSDQTAKALLVVIVVVTLGSLAVQQYRRVRPTPDREVRA